MKPANRLAFIKEYYFSKKLQEIREMQHNGIEVINLGIGSPDLPPPFDAVAQMQLAAKQEKAHQYQSYRGVDELREAFANFYKRNFQVDVNAHAEILPLLGSKEGVMHISMAFLNEGDEVLIPNPSYPTYTSVTKLVGAKPVFYELKEAQGWQPNFQELEQQDLSKVKMMWLNYPHMPTGAKAGKNVFHDAIKFAQKHHILLVNDNPYSFILNDQPDSLLAYPEAKEVGLELNSLSKTFNMAGWRVGAVLGSKENLQSILKVKSNMDSGMFLPIQLGAAVALNENEDWFKNLDFIYQNRKTKLLELVQKLGCQLEERALVGLFVWAKIPSGYKSSEEFSEHILQTHHLFAAPGTVFGSAGEGYIRFSLCVDEATIEKAIKRVEA
ncbi:pyridoxal phosphate-dependent aminotransferase [Mesonia aestuariivivens]|uniref:Aminotransferase class I/II-fold pyridoxal phosphate-dependent enzyme n=1 Tax=Mesonia aestuariivivens TaxID=2796128 RepID=A0ABS6W470_9FLAO|nr:aminotransferase class I/II-fold pyridoxal phosphate-dependent enzyme [Mesonia aestuariivivens]MBW2962663.1 aminotransferase class I/II-fold pyridoxal phosphate-dependent enzyme [Mesonia aestuariivivens]